MTPPQRTRVLVVGGGPVGLLVSLLLSRRGIPNVVVERRSETQRAPAAHVLRRRSMDVLDEVGVGDEIRRAAAEWPLDWIVWCTTLAGAEIGRLDLRPRDPRTGVRPDAPWTHCSQNRLEPILLEAAVRRVEACILRGWSCVDLETDTAGATARVRSPDGRLHRIEAAYVVAADGAGSPTRRALGIEMDGPGPLGHFTMVHFEADLWPWIRRRPGPIFWILNPEAPATLIVHDPTRSHVMMLPSRDGRTDDPGSLAARIRAALGTSVPLRVVTADGWSPHVQVAARYRAGPVLLVGDAAHRFPPTGGLGLNTGILEARVLVETLARVESARSQPDALDLYEDACRPAARANADASLENLVRLGEIARAIGPCVDLAGLERRLSSLTTVERNRLDAAIEAQRSHFLSDGTAPGGAGPGWPGRQDGRTWAATRTH